MPPLGQGPRVPPVLGSAQPRGPPRAPPRAPVVGPLPVPRAGPLRPRGLAEHEALLQRFAQPVAVQAAAPALAAALPQGPPLPPALAAAPPQGPPAPAPAVAAALPQGPPPAPAPALAAAPPQGPPPALLRHLVERKRIPHNMAYAWWFERPDVAGKWGKAALPFLPKAMRRLMPYARPPEMRQQATSSALWDINDTIMRNIKRVLAAVGGTLCPACLLQPENAPAMMADWQGSTGRRVGRSYTRCTSSNQGVASRGGQRPRACWWTR